MNVRRAASLLWPAAKGSVEALSTSLRLARAIRRGPVVSVWIGDSHSLFFNGKPDSPFLTRGDNGHFVWHLGPRLMWSLGSRGYPARLRAAARAVRRIGGSSASVVPILTAGEIDVRCHLGARPSDSDADFSFVGAYVSQGRGLARTLGAESVVFVVPVPPGADWTVHTRFPIRGSLSERLAAFAALRAALADAVARAPGLPRAYLLDATDLLADQGGQLDPRLTSDGCHVDADGAALVHQRLAELMVLVAQGPRN